MAWGRNLLLVFILSAIVNSFVLPLDVSLSVGGVISQTNDVFACGNFDWWPHNKCDYGNCPWGELSILNNDLKNEKLRNAVAAFNGKFHLRLGGSLSDFVVYNVPGDNSSDGYCKYPDFSEPTNTTRLGYEIMSGCFEMSRWDELNEFCVSI